MRLLANSLTLLALCVVITAGCSSSPSGPPPFQIVTPTGTRVSVLPGESVRFEVTLIDPNLTAEYTVDGGAAQPGPVFVFQPTNNEHTVTLLISSDAGAAPFSQTYNVVVEVPGNEPPEITSTTFEPVTGGEAVRDVFTFTVTAADLDGSVASIELDFGDGTPPVQGPGPTLVAEHVFDAAGTYTARVKATDDVQIFVTSEFTVFVLPPNQLPTGSIAINGTSSGGPVEGDGPFTVRLTVSGSDSDGIITLWELDADNGEGFRTISPTQTVEVAYPFSETLYRPVLRLTDDDGDSNEIPSAVDVRVFRSINPDLSSGSVTGNPLFDNFPIAPAVFADGNDALVVDVDVIGVGAMPLADVPVRLTPLRPELVTPSGINLGVPAAVELTPPRTNVTGRATTFLTSNTSTRVEAIPDISFVPFDIMVEANKGHGVWVEIDRLSGNNAETIVSASDGGLAIDGLGQSGYCPGDPVAIRVQARVRAGAPGAGGPARGRYTEIRRGFGNPVALPAQPAAAFTNWRTDGSGQIIFNYVPTEEDRSQIIIAWVDGQPLNQLTSFNFRADCP
jgi:hypothetical protein